MARLLTSHAFPHLRHGQVGKPDPPEPVVDLTAVGAFPIGRDDPNAFESVLTFEPAGEETRIVMRTVFPTKELLDEAVEK